DRPLSLHCVVLPPGRSDRTRPFFPLLPVRAFRLLRYSSLLPANVFPFLPWLLLLLRHVPFQLLRPLPVLRPAYRLRPLPLPMLFPQRPSAWPFPPRSSLPPSVCVPLRRRLPAIAIGSIGCSRYRNRNRPWPVRSG